MTPSWYDVLDVDPAATEDEIRAAWKVAIADLDPTDRRFKASSAAAEVLLDPERRAAHDADLASGAADQDEPVVAGPAAASAASAASAADATSPGPSLRDRTTGRLTGATAALRARRTGREDRKDAPGRRRAWLVPAVLGALALVLVVATAVALVRGSDGRPLPDDSEVAAARSAAEAAVVPILSYDYRRLAQDKSAAGELMTDSYREEYDQYFSGAVEQNAPTTETVVTVELLSSGIVRTGPDQVDVLTFINRPYRNTQGVQTSRDQVVLRMVDQDDQWLVDCLITTPGGTCG